MNFSHVDAKQYLIETDDTGNENTGPDDDHADKELITETGF